MAAKKGKRTAPARPPASSRWTPRRVGLALWLGGLLALIGLAAYPPGTEGIRIAVVTLVALLAGGLATLLWRWRVAFWCLLGVYAALAAFCISYIFFGRLRARVAGELAASRTPKPKAGSDEDAEDTVVEHESVGRDGAERES